LLGYADLLQKEEESAKLGRTVGPTDISLTDSFFRDNLGNVVPER